MGYSLLLFPTPAFPSNATNTWIHKCNFVFCHCWAKKPWDLLVNIQGIPLNSMWKMELVWMHISACFLALTKSASLRAVSFPCKISTSLPLRKFMLLSAHIQMALEGCNNSNWTSTFQSVYEWYGIPMSELEPHGFWAVVLFLQNLCRIKNIYHLGKK